MWRFARQSIVAGADVAWRALDPRLPLRPGFVNYPAWLPAGAALDAFCAFMSLAPGTLAAGSNESGPMVVHCLDVGQRVSSNLTADEERFARALGYGRDHGWFSPRGIRIRAGHDGHRSHSRAARPSGRGSHDGGAAFRHRRHRGGA